MNKRRYKEYKVVINTKTSNAVLNYEYDPNENINVTPVGTGMFYKGLYRLTSTNTANTGTVNTGTAYPRSLNDVFSKYKKALEDDPLHVYQLYNSVDENAILNVIKNGNGYIYLKRMPDSRYYDDAVIDRIEQALVNSRTTM